MSHRVLGYQPSLDGLRAFAALAVVGFHLRLPGFDNGYLGVDIFFTLSGFLITVVLLKAMTEGHLNFKAFYMRRARRLLPAYFAVVLVCVIADLLIDVGSTLIGAVVSFLYVANWTVGLTGLGLGSLGHTWSLSIEEQFYLGWPALLALLMRASGRWSRLSAQIIALMIICYGLTFIALTEGIAPSLVYNATPCRAVELLAGCSLASLVSTCEPTSSRFQGTSGLGSIGGLVCLGGLWILVIAANFRGSEEILILWPAASLLTCGVIASALIPGSWLRRLLSLRPLVSIGAVSYGLYLWHYPILTSIDTLLGLDSWAPRLLGVGLTAIVVPLSYRFIEKPFLGK